MRFWTAYAFLALTITTKAWSAAGAGDEHHASITDLIAPIFNVGVLFAVLIYATKDKLKTYFIKKSEEVTNTIERADIKAREAQFMLEDQKRKHAGLESELKQIYQHAEADVVEFEQKLSKETQEKIAKMKTDATSKIAADKKQILDELNAELLEQVINKTKMTIRSNKDYQSKISTKMLQGLE